MTTFIPQRIVDSTLQHWKAHPFYTQAVVLGLDVGLEGIGVCVRQGKSILYARTWQYDVPEAARLEDRRQKRAWRHCRANRKTRLHRLKLLFEKHGLPWHADRDPALLNSDPYMLRHRAVKTEGGGLASPEALSLALRHCVAHRGYEYDYFNDEGAYPWGDATEFKKVLKELAGLWLTREDAAKARVDAAALEWEEAELLEFDRILAERTRDSEILEARLSEHAKGAKNHNRIRAKGEAFPRVFVWQHMEKIISRHAHFIRDVEGFLTALAVHPKRGGRKDDAIFYYHRKTPAEMREHFNKKRARCPYAAWLGLGEHYIEKAEHIAIRRFRLLEFAATRNVEMERKKTLGRSPVPLGETLTAKLLAWIEAHPNARTQKEAAEIVEELRGTLEETHSAKISASGGKRPSALNEWFFKTLRDLLAPNVANRRKNAGMCAAAAERLFAIATAKGVGREAINAALSQCRPTEGDAPAGLYDFRRKPQPDLYGVYPQVEFLLGQRVKKATTRHGKVRGDLAHDGRLQRLFAQLSPKIGGRLVPEFCIVETARDLPRNTKQKKEREDHIKENEERRKGLFPKYKVEDNGKGRSRQRLELFDQQNGCCPFTGDPLPVPGTPAFDALDLEHLFPENRGGLTMSENLVLTSAKVNREMKKNRTPREFSDALGIPFEAMEAHTKGMRWGKAKRDIFAWDKPDEIPPFGNTTRVAQLAKQLHAEIARWMKLGHDADREAAHLGNPTGFLTAACRRAWGMPDKDRTDLTHHLVDAVILSHIPPREGQNYVLGKGIFIPSVKVSFGEERTVLDVLPLGPNPADVAKLVAHDAVECPVERHRSTSKHKSLHDQTLLGVFEIEAKAAKNKAGGMIRQLFYRKELDRSDKKLDAVTLEQRLIQMGVGDALRPSRRDIEQWLTAKDAPAQFLLRDGSTVRALYEESDQFKTPFGYTCKLNSDGNWQGIKIFKDKSDALEIWWDTDAKGCRFYLTQRRPTRPALQSLLALALNWFKMMSKREGWPFPKEHQDMQTVIGVLRRLRTTKLAWNNVLRRSESQKLLRALINLGFDADGKTPDVRWSEFHSAIWGKPVSAAARPVLRADEQGKLRPVALRKNDAFLIALNSEGDVTANIENAYARRWYRVSAIKSDGRVSFVMLLEKNTRDTDGKAARMNADGLRPSLEKSAADDLARLLQLPAFDDPPLNSPQRKPRPPRSIGETDLGLE